MLQRLGAVLLVLGLLTGDSDNLLVPAVLLIVGFVAMCIGDRKETDNETGKKEI